MKKESILYGIIGLLLGLLIAGGAAVLAVNNDNRGMMRMMGMDMSRIQDGSAGHMGMSMDAMTAELTDKTGDDLDESFISMMIAHHQGAVYMAHAARQNAKHDEVKKLADEIITTQSQEIDMMRDWQKEWGYSDDLKTHMMH